MVRGYSVLVYHETRSNNEVLSEEGACCKSQKDNKLIKRKLEDF